MSFQAWFASFEGIIEERYGPRLLTHYTSSARRNSVLADSNFSAIQVEVLEERVPRVLEVEEVVAPVFSAIS